MGESTAGSGDHTSALAFTCTAGESFVASGTATGNTCGRTGRSISATTSTSQPSGLGENTSVLGATCTVSASCENGQAGTGVLPRCTGSSSAAITIQYTRTWARKRLALAATK